MYRIGCTQCVRACPKDVLEMIPWHGCKAKQIASAPTQNLFPAQVFSNCKPIQSNLHQHVSDFRDMVPIKSQKMS
ncbi:hypothetical protein SETIT_1G032100v2 [Setaria italica]|uniref:4Fe-4S ferredoxin-type domain-containing protein n=1 Tax=Setaria italica TaxID=4555 RepID=K3YZW6_SETIT|nr:hypothetical protein SETIT_1G032100v2 [Setaria italica]